MYLRFTTPTQLDLRELFTLGLGSKRGVEGKIGHKGSGMKFTLALLHRLGSHLTVRMNGATWKSYTHDEEVRGTAHTLIGLGNSSTGLTVETHITLNAGADTWTEPWFALRELLQNCIDEQGDYAVRDTAVDEDDGGNGTQCAVYLSEPLAKAWEDRHCWFHGRNKNVVYVSTDPGLYYHGFQIMPGKDWAFAYDVTDVIERDKLSEDRQARNLNMWDVFRGIVTNCPALPDEFYTAAVADAKKDDLSYLSSAIEGKIYRDQPNYGGFKMADLDAAWITKYGNRACWTDASDSKSQEWYYAQSAGYSPVFVSYYLRRLVQYSGIVKAAGELLPDIQKRLTPVSAKAIEADKLAVLKQALRITKRLRPEGCKVEVVAPRHAGDTLNAGGLACMDSNKVLLLEDYVLRSSLEELVCCLVEEYMHLKSGAGDISEKFQRALIAQIADMLTPKTRSPRSEAVLSL